MNILFICPLFHGYYKKMMEILISNRNSVHYYPTDNLQLSKIDRFRKKINKNFLYKRYDNYIKKIIYENENTKFDKVVVVFGGLYFNKNNFIQLKKAYPNAEFIYYNWDSVDNGTSNAKEYYNLFDKYYSFDLVDCKKYGFKHLPLFYTFDKTPNNESIIYDYGALMTIGGPKAKRYVQIKNALGSEYNGKEYLVMADNTQYIFNYIKHHKYFKKINKNFINFKPLPLNESVTYYDDCRAVIDVPLEGQNGLTIRTFEVLKQQKKLITVNKMIKEYEFYTPNNIFIVDDEHTKVPKEFFETPFDTNYSISENYSIESFVKKLFELQ